MPFQYELRDIPSGDAGTYATVEEMGKLIRQGVLNPRIRLLATQIVAGLPMKDHEAEAKAIFW